jgi:hypothetical protein
MLARFPIREDKVKFVIQNLLYQGYQTLSAFESAFYPRALRVALEAFHLAPTNENILAVYRAFFASPTWGFSALRSFSRFYFTKAYRLLYVNRLLNDENNGQANFDLVLRNVGFPDLVAKGLLELHRSGLLTNANRYIVHNPSSRFIEILSILRENGVLRGELAQANFDALVEFCGPILRRSGIAQAEEEYLLRVFSTLKEVGLSIQANFSEVIRGSEVPEKVGNALLILRGGRLLTDANREAVVAIDPGLASIVNEAFYVLCYEEGSVFRTAEAQVYFNGLMMHSAILLIPGVWSRIPVHTMTEERFNSIIEIAEAHAADVVAGQRAFAAYVDREILGIVAEGGGGARVYNGAQSTHTASVHASASDSALRLKSRYGSMVNETTLDSFSIFLASQSVAANSELLAARAQVASGTSEVAVTEARDRVEKAEALVAKIEAANRGFTRIIHPEFTYEDPVSRVSLKELLALLWLGTQDAANRIGTLEDAQNQIIEALYESQREYNLSAAGVDTGGSVDAAACAGGTFNKFIERFHGVHKDTTLLIITREGASAKFQALVKQEALAYLQRLKASGNTAELTRLLDAITAPANANTAEPLWESINSSVEEVLFDEFKSLYGDDRSHRDFVALIATGNDVELPLDRLTALRSPASLSAGMAASETASPPASNAALSAAGVGFFLPPPQPAAGEEAVTPTDVIGRRR